MNEQEQLLQYHFHLLRLQSPLGNPERYNMNVEASFYEILYWTRKHPAIAARQNTF